MKSALIGVLEKLPRFAAGHDRRLRVAAREYQRAAAFGLGRPRHGAADEQIAPPRVPTVGRVTGERLREHAVHHREIAARQPRGAVAALAHGGSAMTELQRETIPPR